MHTCCSPGPLCPRPRARSKSHRVQGQHCRAVPARDGTMRAQSTQLHPEGTLLIPKAVGGGIQGTPPSPRSSTGSSLHRQQSAAARAKACKERNKTRAQGKPLMPHRLREDFWRKNLGTIPGKATAGTTRGEGGSGAQRFSPSTQTPPAARPRARCGWALQGSHGATTLQGGHKWLGTRMGSGAVPYLLASLRASALGSARSRPLPRSASR